MDDRTRILVCLGSAVAANCVSCFRHYHAKAHAAGLDAADVREAVEMGAQVKHGAHAVLMGAVEAATGRGESEPPSCCGGSTPPTCGT
jgi:alkylhydroperoxidase/carboxymuconolactone decarboxylase family protein YurZ